MTTLVSATARNRRLLWITFGLTASYLFVEIVGGLVTNSFALLADAAHMLTDRRRPGAGAVRRLDVHQAGNAG